MFKKSKRLLSVTRLLIALALFLALGLGDIAQAADTVAPAITILGANPAEVIVGNAYVDAGATAFDDKDGNITNDIITADPVNANLLGTYLVTYSVTDGAGNSATTQRTVNIVTAQDVAIFDFAAALPGRPTPIDQTANGLTAHFSSPSDSVTGVFSVQNQNRTFQTLLQLPNNYLAQNQTQKRPLDISFSQPLSAISLTFATAELEGIGGVDIPSDIKLTAYLNSVLNPAVGTAIARGAYPAPGAGVYPQGILRFNSAGQPFNLVRVELPPRPGVGGAASMFFVDNVIATKGPPLPDTQAPTILLTGAALIDVVQNGTYAELGAVWTDDVDGTGQAVVGGDAVNTAILGSYVVTYDYTDAAGNPATQVTRTVNVVAPPVCETGADANLDGAISNLEILNHVRGWKSGTVSNLEVLKSIRFWKAGTGC